MDFVLRMGKRVVAIEVKSGASRGFLPGMESFVRAFRPHRSFLVGGDGLPLEKFFETPALELLLGTPGQADGPGVRRDATMARKRLGRQALIVAILLITWESPAYAHGVEVAIRLVGGIGMVIGVLAGLVCGIQGVDPRTGWGWSLALLFAAGVAFSGIAGAMENEVLSGLGAGLVLSAILVPIAGAIPAALTCFGTFHLVAFVKNRLTKRV